MKTFLPPLSVPHRGLLAIEKRAPGYREDAGPSHKINTIALSVPHRGLLAIEKVLAHHKINTIPLSVPHRGLRLWRRCWPITQDKHNRLVCTSQRAPGYREEGSGYGEDAGPSHKINTIPLSVPHRGLRLWRRCWPITQDKHNPLVCTSQRAPSYREDAGPSHKINTIPLSVPHRGLLAIEKRRCWPITQDKHNPLVCTSQRAPSYREDVGPSHKINTIPLSVPHRGLYREDAGPSHKINTSPLSVPHRGLLAIEKMLAHHTR
ncbi:hypothetical protein J6590_014908 [Homalodisca vitripennis]|nr:hypothetical protein J6590_014908 [Homalodisca vitripennis]